MDILKVLTTWEAAAALRCSRATLYRLRRAGKLRTVKPTGRTLWVGEDVLALLQVGGAA